MKQVIFILFITFPNFLSAQDITRVRSYIDTLTSPHLHGRGYVNKGDSLAAVYLEDRFKELGLQFFSKSNESHPYWQNFPLSINTFPGKLSLEIDGKILEPGKDYILHPASSGGKKKLQILYIDSLYLTNSKKLKKFRSLKADKYAFVLAPEIIAGLDKLSQGIKNKIYSAGVLIELNDKKLTASLARKQYNFPYIILSEKSFDVNAKTICLEIEAVYKEKYLTQNVIGFVKGTSVADSFYIISAHYDHLGRMGNDIYFPGANDNASGISMLLELARYYSKNPPKYSVAFMAFGAEEAGLVGSEYYTNNPLFSLSKIKFMVNLDLLGTGDDGIMAVNGTVFQKEFILLDSINNQNHYLPAIKKRGPAPNSDHYHFTQKGVPAFFLYTLGGVAAYHDIYDIPETLPLTKFSEVFKLLVTFLEKL